jgi:hypothetical protein
MQVHLVEVSPYMRQQQWEKLQCSSSSSSSSNSSSSSSGGNDNHGSSSAGTGAGQQQQQEAFESGVSGLNNAKVCSNSQQPAL